jgi:hypothetical protein
MNSKKKLHDVVQDKEKTMKSRIARIFLFIPHHHFFAGPPSDNINFALQGCVRVYRHYQTDD